MAIQPIDSEIRSELTHATELRRPRRTSEIDRRTAVPEEPAQMPSQEEPDKPEKVRGVIRLLESGHFSGVAEVRLRINFFDELSNRANAAREVVLQEGADNISDAVRNGVSELLASGDFGVEVQEPINTALEDFERETRALLEEGIEAGPSLSDSLGSAITPIFEALVANLTELLTAETEDPAPPGTGETPPPEPDGAAAPASDARTPLEAEESVDAVGTLDDAVADLRAVFAEAVAGLIASLESVSRLPEPSPPGGNGRAFEAAMEIYSGLRQQARAIDVES